jgi:hypothetical protein
MLTEDKRGDNYGFTQSNKHTYNITVKQTFEKIQTIELKRPIQSTRLTQNKQLSQA